MDKIVYIYSHNYLSGGRRPHFREMEDAGRPSEELCQITIRRNMSVAAIASVIIDELGDSNAIRKLIVVTHGFAGNASIGEGININTYHALQPLTDYFAPENEGIHFNGCRIASSSLERWIRRPEIDTSVGSEEGNRAYDEIWDNIERMQLRVRQVTVRRAARLSTSEDDFRDLAEGSWYGDGSEPDFQGGDAWLVGITFMRALAGILSVNVTAPIDSQIIRLRRRRRIWVDEFSGYEGRYITVCPDGSHSGILTGRDLAGMRRYFR